MRRVRLAGWLSSSATFLLLAFCLASPVYSQASNQHVTMEIENGRVMSRTSEPIPPAVMEEPDLEPKLDAEESSSAPPDKLHPLLREMMELGDESAQEVIVNFRDSLKIPRFPGLVPGEPRTSNRNKAVRLRAAGMVRNIEARRGAIHRKRMKEMGPRYQLEFVRSFWLTDAMIVRMPVGLMKDLAQHPDVLYIMPKVTGDPPPIGDGNPSNDVSDGRQRINSDAYFNLNLYSEYIALLDSGVRFSHVQFTNPSNIGFRRDCVNGNLVDCSGGDPWDRYWNHGTSAAAILTANANQGDDYRGVTAMTVDSIKVYHDSDVGLDVAAAMQGIQEAVGEMLDTVIVANVQATGLPASSPLSTTADNAFDAGVVVIAANGNTTSGQSTVTSPANAHKVLGVGAVDVVNMTTWPTQTVGPAGPAPDNRIKPDLQAPTNTETASNASDTALRVFGATSGAAPYAGGAAALFRNWLDNLNGDASVEPGEVYAYMILSGQISWPDFNNTTGVGPIVMQTGGTSYSGKVTFTATGQVFNIPFTVAAGTRLDAALWWPERHDQSHSDIDLRLIDPSGVERAVSRSGPSVFERARYNGTVSAGTWTLRISGFAVPSGSQTVYYTAYRR